MAHDEAGTERCGFSWQTHPDNMSHKCARTDEHRVHICHCAETWNEGVPGAGTDLREYLRANLFDGSEDGVQTQRIDRLLDDVVHNVEEWLRGSKAHTAVCPEKNCGWKYTSVSAQEAERQVRWHRENHHQGVVDSSAARPDAERTRLQGDRLCDKCGYIGPGYRIGKHEGGHRNPKTGAECGYFASLLPRPTADEPSAAPCSLCGEVHGPRCPKVRKSEVGGRGADGRWHNHTNDGIHADCPGCSAPDETSRADDLETWVIDHEESIGILHKALEDIVAVGFAHQGPGGRRWQIATKALRDYAKRPARPRPEVLDVGDDGRYFKVARQVFACPDKTPHKGHVHYASNGRGYQEVWCEGVPVTSDGEGADAAS